MAKKVRVERPIKKHEYEIVFATASAKRGWQDLRAVIPNPLADAWDFLTRSPMSETAHNYRLRGSLGKVTRNGQTFERWQHKPTIKGDARIWFFVDGQTVYLEQVHTHHPNETKS